MKTLIPVKSTPLLFCAVALFCLGSAPVISSTVREMDKNGDGKTDQWVELLDDATTMVRKDRNFDGKVDFELVYDSNAKKITETADFNYDGYMDDFYFYQNGILVRREIDTDFDKQVDLWVFLRKGIYISRIERDLDGDGKIDYLKQYGAEDDQ